MTCESAFLHFSHLIDFFGCLAFFAKTALGPGYWVHFNISSQDNEIMRTGRWWTVDEKSLAFLNKKSHRSNFVIFTLIFSQKALDH